MRSYSRSKSSANSVVHKLFRTSKAFDQIEKSKSGMGIVKNLSISVAVLILLNNSGSLTASSVIPLVVLRTIWEKKKM